MSMRKFTVPANESLGTNPLLSTLSVPAVSIQTERRFRWWDYLIFAVLTLFHAATIAGVFWYGFLRVDWARAPILFGLLALTFLGNLVLWEWRWLLLPVMRVPRPIKPKAGWRVGVATTFVPGAESIEMLEETVKAMVAMEYPHDTWVLDEGDDDAVKALCARLGAYYFTRKHKPQYQTESSTFKARTKYGNYNAWFDAIGYECYDIITTFDTDHIPHRDFLQRVLGYFVDPQIGYVQAAQAYYNQDASFIARGAAEETYAYFSSIQMTSAAIGYPIVTGCHNTHRVTALKEVGGFAAHDADDMLITLYYRAQGWRGVYLPLILARGLTPVDWRGYLTQQRRWARSTLDIKFLVYPRLAHKLPFAERVVSFVHGLYYVRSLITVIQLSLLVVMLMTGIVPSGSAHWLPALALVWLSMFAGDMYRQRFFLNPRREWGLHWRAAFLEYAKWPFMLLALVEVFGRYRGPYTITPKVRARSSQAVFASPHLIIIGLVGSAWMIGVLLGNVGSPILHASSALIVGMSLVVVFTTRFRFPDSYDPVLRAQLDEDVAA